MNGGIVRNTSYLPESDEVDAFPFKVQQWSVCLYLC